MGREPRRGVRRQDIGEHCRALDGRGSDLDDRAPWAEPPGRHGPLRREPEHLPDHERLAHRARDLGVAPDERRPHLVERAPHPGEERRRIVSGRSLGQQHTREKPSRARPGHGDIVRIDDDGVRPRPRRR